ASRGRPSTTRTIWQPPHSTCATDSKFTGRAMVGFPTSAITAAAGTLHSSTARQGCEMSRTARQPRTLVEHNLVPMNGIEGFIYLAHVPRAWSINGPCATRRRAGHPWSAGKACAPGNGGLMQLRLTRARGAAAAAVAGLAAAAFTLAAPAQP